MKILLVDDDPVILDLLQLVLRQEDHHHVEVVASGAGALDILSRAEDAFDILILDIAMPEMDGVCLCEKVRKMPAYRSTPIIMLTAKVDVDTIESAFAAGANDYITKPFDIKGIGYRIQVAERMMRESHRVFTDYSPTRPLSDTYQMQGFNIEDSVRIFGINQHTDPFSLGNYLLQLSRARIEKSSVFALKINRFESLFDTLSSQELILVVGEVANAISAVAADKRLLTAYTGSGSFTCIATEDMFDAWVQMEHRLADYLKKSEPLRTANRQMEISITMGRPFRPVSSKTTRVRQTFDRAASLLEARLIAV